MTRQSVRDGDEGIFARVLARLGRCRNVILAFWPVRQKLPVFWLVKDLAGVVDVELQAARVVRRGSR